MSQNQSEDVAAPRTGVREDLGRVRFTQEEIVRFARAFDPQPFHVDPAAAAASPFGGLVASGWHTACVWMGLFVRAHGPFAAPPEAPEILSPVGVGFGVFDLKWLEPVRAGDEIVFATELISARASASRPGWTVFERLNSARRPDGPLVLTFIVRHIAPTAAAIEVTRPAAKAT